MLEAFAKKIGVSKSKLKSHFGEKYDDALEQFVVEHASQVVRLASLDENQIGTEAVSAKRGLLNHQEVLFIFHEKMRMITIL